MSEPPRKTRKKQAPEPERHRVWVAAGGRCTVCRKYLLEGHLSKRPFRLGELAHIVGQQPAAGSPRGTVEPLSAVERDKAENLMLVCAGEHQEIDRDGVLDLFTVDLLRGLKRRHEDWIRRVTGLQPDATTVVLRMLGDVRGQAVELDRATATAAVIRHAGRWPEFSLTYEQDGIEIDLRSLPGENPAGEAYWSSARAKIDQELERVKEGVRQGKVRHVSVFAFARLPLLVYLGSRLDDAYGVTVYQRHRASQGWEWPEGTDIAFAVGCPPADDRPGSHDAVAVLNISGSVQPHELPVPLQALPRFTVTPVGATPGPDVLAAASTLTSFETACRQLLAQIEADRKDLRRLHVVAAAPLAAAVVLGRVRDPHVHPAYVVYDRTDGGYEAVLEIS